MRLSLYPLTGFMLFAAACRNLSGASRQLPLSPKGAFAGASEILSSIRSRGKSPEKPKGFFWSVQGGPEGNRNPSGLVFFCQRFLLPAFSFGEAKENAEGQSQIFNMRSLIVEFLLELCYNAVLYGKHIGLDEQSLVGLYRRDEILPVFKGIQPVFARAIDL